MSAMSPLVPRSSIQSCLRHWGLRSWTKRYQSMSLRWPLRQARTKRVGTTGCLRRSLSMYLPFTSALRCTRRRERGGPTRSRLLVHRKALVKGKYIDNDRRKHPVVPTRFVRACRKGHLSDIDWYRFVHERNPQCRRQLWMDERGTSGDIADIYIRCE